MKNEINFKTKQKEQFKLLREKSLNKLLLMLNLVFCRKL